MASSDRQLNRGRAWLGLLILTTLLATISCSISAAANPMMVYTPGEIACLMIPLNIPLNFLMFGALLAVLLRYGGLEIGDLPKDTKKFTRKVIKGALIISLFGAAIDEIILLANETETVTSVDSYPAIVGTLLIAASVIGTSAWYMRLNTAPSVLIGAVMALLNPIFWLAFSDSERTIAIYALITVIGILPCIVVYHLLKDIHARLTTPTSATNVQAQ